MSPRAYLFAVLALAAPVQAHAANATAHIAVKLRVLPTCSAEASPRDRVSVDCRRGAGERSKRAEWQNADSETAHVVRTHRDGNVADDARVVTIEF